MCRKRIGIELHLHFDGSVTFDFAKKAIADKYQSDEALLRAMTVGNDCKNLDEYLQKFDLPLSMLQSEAAISEAMRLLCCRLKEENTVYAEIRFAPQLHTRGELTQEQVVRAAIKGFEDSSIMGGLILCCMRGADFDVNYETVCVARRFKDEGVLALDLAGNESAYPNEDYFELFEFVRDYGLPFTIHAGEAAGADSVRSALRMGAARIGHGVRACENKELLAMLAEQQIPLELCPTSNLNTCVFSDISEYPLRQLMQAGVKVTLNSDNRTVSNTNFQKEMQLLCNAFSLTEQEQVHLLLNSTDAAFCNFKVKEKLKELIKAEYLCGGLYLH